VLTKLAIFAWAVTPLPDDTVIVPLAMVNYGVRRIALPLFTGKVAHNLVIAYVFYHFAVDPPVSPQVKTDLALVIIVTFVLIVLYQVERARAVRADVAVLE
jgi:hypothetical protein